MTEQLEQYIKDLPPELQEKAKEIKTKDELMEFLADNELELPEDALEMVSGGCGTKKTDPIDTPIIVNPYNPDIDIDV